MFSLKLLKTKRSVMLSTKVSPHWKHNI